MFNLDYIKHYITVDDLWLKLVEVLSNVPTVVCSLRIEKMREGIPDTQAQGLFNKNVGKNENDLYLKVYLYKTSDEQKKPKAIKLDKVSTEIKHSAAQANLQIETTRYVYRDNFIRIMFGVFSHNNELKQRKYIFTIPSNWKVISTRDMKKLQKQLEEKMQAQKAAALH